MPAMPQMPDGPAHVSASPSARAADAADVMAVALRLGVGLPSGVERQSAHALDGMAKSLREGEGSDSPEAITAIISIVPAPARGIMRLAAAGGDVRALLSFLERIVAVDRRQRWDRRLAVDYPLGVAVCALLGIGVLALVQDPLLNSLSEPIQLAVPPPEVAQSPVLDAVVWPGGVMATMLLAIAVVWLSQGQRRAEASRRWAAVACELDAVGEAIGLPAGQRDEILADLRPIARRNPWCPEMPPLAAFLKKQPAADGPRGFAAVARFYRETSDAITEQRVRLLPVVGGLVAGLAVLLYGIALFVPLTRLFTTLALMPVAPPWSPGS